MVTRILALLAIVLVSTSAGSPTPVLSASRAATDGVQQAPARERRFSDGFNFGGAVENPTSYHLADLQAMPSHTVTVEFRSGNSMKRATYRGVRLYDMAMAAKPRFNPLVRNDALSWYVQVAATDGYVATIGWGEIAPAFQNKAVLVAYEEDGKLLSGADGMARLVVPGDQRGGRYVSQISSIRVLQSYMMGR